MDLSYGMIIFQVCWEHSTIKFGAMSWNNVIAEPLGLTYSISFNELFLHTTEKWRKSVVLSNQALV